MQIILTKDIDTLGQAHELVTVKPGYARNFLLPNKLAVEASPANMAKMQGKARLAAKQEAKLLAEISNFTDTIKAGAVKVTAKTGTSGKIFGSVTSIQIARAIREQKGYEIDRKRITILDEVKELGTFKANINFGQGEPVEMEFEVVGE
jgi:large subunit ribosomal protein L9